MELEWRDEIVRQVEAADGASEVMFNWNAAQRALDELTAAIERLGTEQNDRSAAILGWDGQPGLDEWVGPFKTDFENASASHHEEAVLVKQALEGLGDGIVDTARLVNQEQEQRNMEANG